MVECPVARSYLTGYPEHKLGWSASTTPTLKACRRPYSSALSVRAELTAARTPQSRNDRAPFDPIAPASSRAADTPPPDRARPVSPCLGLRRELHRATQESSSAAVRAPTWGRAGQELDSVSFGLGDQDCPSHRKEDCD